MHVIDSIHISRYKLHVGICVVLMQFDIYRNEFTRCGVINKKTKVTLQLCVYNACCHHCFNVSCIKLRVSFNLWGNNLIKILNKINLYLM